MIEFKSGNIFESEAEALVNPVNTRGISGAGLALQFKKRYPENFKAYQQACERGALKLGQMFLYWVSDTGQPKYIINFPTKKDWRDLSGLKDIEEGLVDLVVLADILKLRSVAVPLLGCGLGRLDKETVLPLMQEQFAREDGIHWIIYG